MVCFTYRRTTGSIRRKSLDAGRMYALRDRKQPRSQETAIHQCQLPPGLHLGRGPNDAVGQRQRRRFVEFRAVRWTLRAIPMPRMSISTTGSESALRSEYSADSPRSTIFELTKVARRQESGNELRKASDDGSLSVMENYFLVVYWTEGVVRMSEEQLEENTA